MRWRLDRQLGEHDHQVGIDVPNVDVAAVQEELVGLDERDVAVEEDDALRIGQVEMRLRIAERARHDRAGQRPNAALGANEGAGRIRGDCRREGAVGVEGRREDERADDRRPRPVQPGDDRRIGLRGAAADGGERRRRNRSDTAGADRRAATRIIADPEIARGVEVQEIGLGADEGEARGAGAGAIDAPASIFAKCC
jgi:hypothetical protein